MSKKAQERVLLSQVMREVRANLRHMEQVLDAFFRDHTRRSELAALAKDSQQIRGALRILELDDADRLLALCQTQIETYANPDTPVDEEGLELLAESLSGLGFYIDAVLHQRPDRERIIAPLIAQAPRRSAATGCRRAAIGRGFGRRTARRIAAADGRRAATRLPTHRRATNCAASSRACATTPT